eukprot:COSAG01_NODE_1835_length_9084_cov_87.179481_14_plen_138_part_00
MFEKLLEAGRNTPLGPLFVAIDGLYKMLKGAKSNRAAFRRQLEADVRLMLKASGVAGVEESVARVQEVVERATAFVEQAEQRGLFGRLRHVNNDKAQLEALVRSLSSHLKVAVSGVPVFRCAVADSLWADRARRCAR